MRHCNIVECLAERTYKLYCPKHQQRVNRNGDPNKVLVRVMTHGMSNKSEYNIWCNIKTRCYNKKTKRYKDYGAIGIKVCEEWLNDFPKFLSDMGDRPSNKHSIERINPYGNYEPSNCKWATQTEQARNIRTRSDNKVGFTGVYECRDGNDCFVANITVEKRNIYIGHYNNLEQALSARLSAEAIHWA